MAVLLAVKGALLNDIVCVPIKENARDSIEIFTEMCKANLGVDAKLRTSLKLRKIARRGVLVCQGEILIQRRK